MVVMEDALVDRHGGAAAAFVERHLRHLSRVGGALTILVHPGQFYNPEHPLTLGLYHELLKVCRQVGVRFETAHTLVNLARR